MQRLLLSRMRILCNHGFFGLLLMHMKYAIDEEIETACTDGRYITFSPAFLEDLSDPELDFVMMHEILHVVLHHCMRGENYNPENFNIACDIVVNSNILLENNMDFSRITLQKYGESMHLAPDGKEGYEYTAEQIYEMLPPLNNKRRPLKGPGSCWDDHSKWRKDEEEGGGWKDTWNKRILDAAEAISVRDPSDTRGLLPLFAKRLVGKLKKAQTDWRQVLNDFIQEDIVDYSFSPPDRRFDDSPFFLPDFNEKDVRVKDVLFMIDTSGSMSDAMITAAYSEIRGAIEQFGGKLEGWLGFFDAAIIEPQPFSSEEELCIIRPAGGGGTNFDIIFSYVNEQMKDPPSSIIILTDGCAPFPKETASGGIPVLWLLNNEKVTPPWGRVARIKVDHKGKENK